MAKKKTTAEASAPSGAPELSTEERAVRAFASMARAPLETKRLTPEELAAFAELVDPSDGVPLHIEEDGTEKGRIVRHGEHDPAKLRENCSQRFSKVFGEFMQRMKRDAQDAAASKQNLLAMQKQMLAARETKSAE